MALTFAEDAPPTFAPAHEIGEGVVRGGLTDALQREQARFRRYGVCGQPQQTDPNSEFHGWAEDCQPCGRMATAAVGREGRRRQRVASA